MNHIIDLDTMSTTRINEEVLKTYKSLLDDYYANSESIHSLGQQVHTLQETSRSKIAELLKIRSDEVIFTSGASEANNLAIKGYCLANKHKGNHIITSCIEHASVLNSFKQLEEVFGFDVTYLSIGNDGKVNLDELVESIRIDTIFVSIMFVNNEIGSINDIATIGEILKKYPKIAFHSDLVQGVGKYPFSLMNVDMATISSHKINGLKGSGVLVKKHNINLLSLISAGDQEFGLRGGTSNAPVNIVFAKTLRLAINNQKDNYELVSKLHKYMYEELSKLKFVHFNSSYDSKYIINFSVESLTSEILMNALNEKGILVSSTSTCSARIYNDSYVLKALEVNEFFRKRAIRIGISKEIDYNDIDYFIKSIKEISEDYGF